MARVKVALTFDDGPTKWTDELLDLFEEYGGHATFFVLGSRIERRAATVLRMAYAGHEIGNHGFSHISFPHLTDAEAEVELMMTASALKEIGVSRWSNLWRAPHHAKTDRDVRLARALGLIYVGTNLDPGDWFKDADGIEAHIRSDMQEGSIINLHDGAEGGQPTREPTVEAVRRLLADGTLTSVTVSELWSAP